MCTEQAPEAMQQGSTVQKTTPPCQATSPADTMFTFAHRRPRRVHAGGLQSDGALLLNFSRSFTNFLGGSRAAYLGWTQNTTNIPCAWTGIQCSSQAAGPFSINLPSQVPPGIKCPLLGGTACWAVPHGERRGGFRGEKLGAARVWGMLRAQQIAAVWLGSAVRQVEVLLQPVWHCVVAWRLCVQECSLSEVVLLTWAPTWCRADMQPLRAHAGPRTCAMQVDASFAVCRTAPSWCWD